MEKNYKELYYKYKNKYIKQKKKLFGGNINRIFECMTFQKQDKDLSRYYTHTYNPDVSYITNLFTDLSFSEKEGVDLSDVIDFESRENCCNCIGITMYSNGNLKPERLDTFLNCITDTAITVNNVLPNWIVRLYYNRTIEDHLNDSSYSSINLSEKFEYIKNLNNTELYLYDCSSTIIERTRIFRYHLIYDTTVNYYVIREADGVVSYLDAHNINNFFNSDNYKETLFYIPDIVSQVRFDHTKHQKQIIPFKSYSNWLDNYKISIGHNFFNKYINIIDLIAGGFSSKIKLKTEYFSRKLNLIIEKLKEIWVWANNEENLNNYYLENNHDISYSSFEDKFKNNLIYEVDGRIKALESSFENIIKKKFNNFNIGFDEIFLLELFKSFISIQYTKINQNFFVNNEQFDKIKNIFSTFVEKEKYIYYTTILIDDIGPLLYNIDMYIHKNLPYYYKNEKMVNFKIINGDPKGKHKINSIYELLNIPFDFEKYKSVNIDTNLLYLF